MMTIQSKIRNLNVCGQAFVEFALILPLLLLLVFGITEFGRYLFFKNSATNAAREGARKAVVTNPWDSSIVISVVNSSPSMNDATVTISSNPSPPTTGTAVTVLVRKSFSSLAPAKLPWFGGDLSLPFSNLTSIRASATMRYE